MKLIELMNEIQKCKSMEEMMAIADRDDVVSSAESLVQEIKDLLVKFGEKHTELKSDLEKAVNAEGWTMEQVLEYADAVKAGEIDPNTGSSSWKKETMEKVDTTMDQLNVVRPQCNPSSPSVSGRADWQSLRSGTTDAGTGCLSPVGNTPDAHTTGSGCRRLPGR